MCFIVYLSCGVNHDSILTSRWGFEGFRSCYYKAQDNGSNELLLYAQLTRNIRLIALADGRVKWGTVERGN